MSESQSIEYKQSWRDEYLKWICGFANANGGIIFIGKDDNGNVVGLADAKRLLEEIPNKVRAVLGILADTLGLGFIDYFRPKLLFQKQCLTIKRPITSQDGWFFFYQLPSLY